MEVGRASVSAMGSAVLRAAHVTEDNPPWVLQDTVSMGLLTEFEIGEIENSMADWPADVRDGFRLTHAVRARLAEDLTIEGLAAGRRDYVILGAGLDSFSLRHPRAAELMIWEVDHSDTQQWKRQTLRRSGRSEPANVRYVSIDLSVSNLQDFGLPSVATWNWLGVTMYLEKSATAKTLRNVASMRPGSVLVVNFLLAEDERSELGDALQSAATRVLNAVGEPVLASYSRIEVESLLTATGFSSFQILDASDLTERYLKGRTDLCLPSSTIIAIAAV